MVGAGGKQFGLGIGRVPALLATLAHFIIVGGEQAVHGAHRAQILPFIKQRGVDLGRGGIDEAFAMQQVKHAIPLTAAQRA
ncbi:hypothetical protein TSH7_14020 [Azospirillum sp. TSH7]|nr:hypothetical protein TSH7_14020 [Azospirillum sp. TSH7]PWC72706.1 hypothetical protein TSH20_00515 [Azospirillum sp. TSH20]